jgi:hypothetical protein
MTEPIDIFEEELELKSPAQSLILDPQNALYPRTYRSTPKCGTYILAGDPARDFMGIMWPVLNSVVQGLHYPKTWSPTP